MSEYHMIHTQLRSDNMLHSQAQRLRFKRDNYFMDHSIISIIITL